MHFIDSQTKLDINQHYFLSYIFKELRLGIISFIFKIVLSFRFMVYDLRFKVKSFSFKFLRFMF